MQGTKSYLFRDSGTMRTLANAKWQINCARSVLDRSMNRTRFARRQGRKRIGEEISPDTEILEIQVIKFAIIWYTRKRFRDTIRYIDIVSINQTITVSLRITYSSCKLLLVKNLLQPTISNRIDSYDFLLLCMRLLWTKTYDVCTYILSNLIDSHKNLPKRTWLCHICNL